MLETSKLLILAASIVVSVTIFAYRNKLTQSKFMKHGYMGMFFLNVVANATVLLPAPSFVVAFIAGKKLNPFTIALVCALGATIGETTGYFAGYGGKSLVDTSSSYYSTIEKWMEKNGFATLVALAAVPNPFFDLAGVLSGVSHYPFLAFATAVFIGKFIKFFLIALAGRRIL
jgi:membrane protein YqaA with SNARE-associated domain